MTPGNLARPARTVIMAVALFAVMAMAAGPVLAEKLIIFHNGKVMRAKSVSDEGAWTLADLGKGATVGFRTADIVRIEDAVGKTKGSEYNRASTENRGVSRTGGGANRGSGRGAERSSSVQERIEQRQQELEEKRAKNEENRKSGVTGGKRQSQPNSNNRGFRRSRLPGGWGQRNATDQRVVRPSRDNDQN